MGYGYIPENRRAKDVRIDNYDKKFPEGVTNVDLVNSAPHSAPVKKIDETLAARKPDLKYKENENE